MITSSGQGENVSRALHSVILLIVLSASSCSPYTVPTHSAPLVVPPESFSHELSSDQSYLVDGETNPYWVAYKDDPLNSMMENALGDSFSLQEVFARVARARAQAQISGAGRFPALNTEATARRSRIQTGQTILSSGFRPVGEVYQNQFGLLNGLSYEVDIWQRIASAHQAELLRERATGSDYENALLVLSSELFQEWLRGIESLQLRKVLEQQIASSETFLELTQLRFSLSQGTALDVFEQRQQVASLKTQLPQVELSLDQALHRLSVLVGKAPLAVQVSDIPTAYPLLPNEMPAVRPVDLITLRPDLRAILLRLQASEYDVASAIADRFPKLSIGISYDFTTSDIDDLFPNKTVSGFGGLLLPLIDGGRRRGVVQLEKADVEELLARFSDRFLVALQEVEDALSAERHQKELLKSLKVQLQAASDTLSESKFRYANGLVDYLRVLVALQSKQNLERQVISQEKQLLLYRNQLYLALGGKIPAGLKADEDQKESAGDSERPSFEEDKANTEPTEEENSE